MPHTSTSSRTPATTIRGHNGDWLPVFEVPVPVMNNLFVLCKNAHWLFDNGLWTLTDDYKVIVTEGRFAEDGPEQKQLLREFHGQKIHLPNNPAHWPSPVH